ncbi:phosphatidylglycerophosphate synthase [Aurantimicrobium minutum]|uniref:CDP-alcohol phosphatidyltransferase family protein n=1 Tax=Aurantimicrobium minutum TaxID=708131 RepID=UPI002475EF75|nr:CDP-alcohol phosphatidyltransferase family protein [Aurantimicrobium minutum]MDH6409447.1 phosphatidylglycerophosphate synthase [Aurantimicrobium minutum]MDH6424989.1 phosphatidylglycerophosphate synthase [Aurantimicrobium minutum]
MEKPTSLAQLREVTQPPEVRTRANAEHWVAHLYLRDLSPYVTWVLLKTPISANGVTGLMILTGWATAAALLIPGIWGPVLALILGQLQMLIDCCDGEVARWRKTKSPAGHFLDAVGHYTTEALIPLALGLRAAGFADNSRPIDWMWVALGAFLAIVIILNKVLNDLVRVARAMSDLPKLADAKGANAPRPGMVAKLRRLARFVPFHRIYHSVELTIIAFVAAVIGLAVGELQISQVLVAVLLPLSVLAIIGHFVAIMTSSRVRAA